MFDLSSFNPPYQPERLSNQHAPDFTRTIRAYLNVLLELLNTRGISEDQLAEIVTKKTPNQPEIAALAQEMRHNFDTSPEVFADWQERMRPYLPILCYWLLRADSSHIVDDIAEVMSVLIYPEERTYQLLKDLILGSPDIKITGDGSAGIDPNTRTKVLTAAKYMVAKLGDPEGVLYQNLKRTWVENEPIDIRLIETCFENAQNFDQKCEWGEILAIAGDPNRILFSWVVECLRSDIRLSENLLYKAFVNANDETIALGWGQAIVLALVDVLPFYQCEIADHTASIYAKQAAQELLQGTLGGAYGTLDDMTPYFTKKD